MTDVIRIKGLRKSFPPGWPTQAPIQVLNELSLTVHSGEIYGFLGPNGSGKTTTLKILIGLMRPSGGHAEVLGSPLGDVRARRQIGFLPESPYFYDYLTAVEFLTFYGRLSGMEKTSLSRRVNELLHLVGLADVHDRQLRKFSKGMLQRVGLAQAIIHDPDLIVLDEPMSGLDPIGRKQIRDLILSLREQGKTIFFSTHIIPDVEMICDRVGIIVKGRLLAEGTVEALVTSGQTESVEVVCEGLEIGRSPVIAEMASRVLQQGRRCLVVLKSPKELDNLLSLIRQQGATLISVVPQKHGLEELFVEKSGEST